MAHVDSLLNKELETFEQNKREWLRSNPGQFVVIAATTVAGFFPDYESAFKAGIEKFGVAGTFLVKQVWAEQPVYLIH
jgi:hypothetical protein